MHALRVTGVTWLLLLILGRLPAAFALPAGIGDAAIGVTAPLVYARVLPRLGERVGVFLLWNAVGLLDLVLVLVMGIVVSPSVNIAGADNTGQLLAQFPWSLVPTFFAPLFIGGHILAAIIALRASPGASRDTENRRVAT